MSQNKSEEVFNSVNKIQRQIENFISSVFSVMHNWTAGPIGITDFLRSAFSVQICSLCKLFSMKLSKCYCDHRPPEEVLIQDAYHDIALGWG